MIPVFSVRELTVFIAYRLRIAILEIMTQDRLSDGDAHTVALTPLAVSV